MVSTSLELVCIDDKEQFQKNYHITGLELNCLTCKNHNSPIIGFCIADNCNENNKFLCSECIFDVHNGHKIIRIKELNNIIQTNQPFYEECLEVYDKDKTNKKDKIEQFKKDIINKIEKKVTIFLEELDKEYIDLSNQSFENYENLKNYNEYFIENATLDKNIDLNKLTKICQSIYERSNKTKKSIITNDDDNDNKNKGSNNPILEQFNKGFDYFMEKQNISITNYINENFLKMPKNGITFKKKCEFEWGTQVYLNYGFFYELSNNNTKGMKIKSDGIMTILRAKEKLNNDYKYYIKFKIGLKNGGDFDVGIGTNESGGECWLRSGKALCISNEGAYNIGKNVNNSITLNDNDIIDLEICTKNEKQTFKGSINNVQICSLNFNINNDIYIMAAIRNVSNHIEVLEYDSSPI